MKIKLGDLKVAMEGFQVLAEKDLPVKIAYWVGKTINKIGSEFRDLEEGRQKLCVKHCKKDEAKNPVLKTDEAGKQTYDIPNMEAFNVELMELYNMEVEINFNPISLDQIADVTIDSITMMKLDKFIAGE
ncbi:MAG: hypothetical protein ABIG61_15445 [Planctomycetota bacterium]